MSVKSKDSQRKLRRWSFEVVARDRVFHIPVVAFGSLSRANKIAEHVHADYSQVDAFKDIEFKVNPVPHETVSSETFNQLNGLELELKILSVAANDLANQLEDGNKNPQESLGLAIANARKQLAEAYGMSETTLVKEVLDIEESEVDEDDTQERMQLGIHAVKKVLDGE